MFPHDVQVREIGNFGKSRLESLLELGIAGEVAPKLSIEDGIEAVRKDCDRPPALVGKAVPHWQPPKVVAEKGSEVTRKVVKTVC